MARLNNEPRTNESPMDYQYDNGRGPTGNSPFVKDGTGASRLMGGQAGFAAQGQGQGHGQKRTSDELDSPTKSSLPALRKPENQTFLFNSLPFGKSNNQKYYREAAAFTTPRRANLHMDDTTEPESSPALADSENTPDPRPTRSTSPSKKDLQPADLSKSGKKTREFSGTSGFYGGRAGKGEIVKPRSYTDAIHRRISKRRRRETDRDVFNAARRASVESDSEDRPSSSDGPHTSSRQVSFASSKKSHGNSGSSKPMGVIPSVLTFIDHHPNLPNTLSTYIQFFLNCFFAFCFMYVLYGIFATIRHDIDERAMMESSEILTEMALCAREFKDNRCERETRVPAMESVCNGWEKCMARDPYMVGRSRLSAGMFAEIFNSFIEPISLKAIIVSTSIIIGCFAVNNLTFGIYRSRHPTHTQPPHHLQAPPSSSSAMNSQHQHQQQQAYLANLQAQNPALPASYGYPSGFMGGYMSPMPQQQQNMDDESVTAASTRRIGYR